jgi:predicted anti-sigma-YlaC factor YlaD
MSKHITEWLNAYLDGELRGARLQHVEAHLTECSDCRSELESLAKLSNLLDEAPAPEFIPAERFAAQINLLLPQKRVTTSRKKLLEVGWWMIPVGLLAVWIFIGTSFLVTDILAAANGFGLIPGISNWLGFGSASEAYWSATLGQIGVLSGNSLGWASFTEAFTRTSLLQITLEVSIALLYLSWVAIWWARHRSHARQPHGQLLES